MSAPQIVFDWQSLFLFLLTIFCGILGWMGKVLWTAVSNLKDDLTELEVRMGTDYVRYDRLQDALKPITDSLNKIENALLKKQDKP